MIIWAAIKNYFQNILVIRHGSATTYKHEYYHLIHKLICWLEVKDETLNSYQNINLPMLSIFIYCIVSYIHTWGLKSLD